MSIQGAQTNVQLADSYRAANSALSSVLDGMDVDEVDDIILTLEESIERQQRLEGAMSFAEIDPTEQDELEAELDQLARGETGAVDTTPATPISSKPVVTTPAEAPPSPQTSTQEKPEEDLDDMIAELAGLSVCQDQLSEPLSDSTAP